MFHYDHTHNQRLSSQTQQNEQFETPVLKKPHQNMFNTTNNYNANANTRRHFGTNLIKKQINNVNNININANKIQIQNNLNQKNLNLNQNLKNQIVNNNNNQNLFSYAFTKPNFGVKNNNNNNNEIEKPKNLNHQKLQTKTHQKSVSEEESECVCEMSCPIDTHWQPTVSIEDQELVELAYQTIAEYKTYIPNKYYLTSSMTNSGLIKDGYIQAPVIYELFAEIQATTIDLSFTDSESESDESQSEIENDFDMDIVSDEDNIVVADADENDFCEDGLAFEIEPELLTIDSYVLL